VSPVTFEPLDESVKVAISFAWLDAGAVTLDADGRPRFPRLSPSPGIYRLTLFDAPGQQRPRIYIGESDSLVRRAGNYRNPGATQQTSTRVNALLRERLTSGGRVALAVATSASIHADSMTEEALDLSRKSVRLLAESAALVLAQRVGGADLENLH
jgi:hypothetical protein